MGSSTRRREPYRRASAQSGEASGRTERHSSAGSHAEAPTIRREPAAPPAPVLRPPTPEDAASIWRLVRDARVLDVNSAYAYLLLCSDFAETSLVAHAGGRTVGFVGAYRPPVRPDTVFVWQIVTSGDLRHSGLGSSLLDGLLSRPACRSARFLEATVTPSNLPSRALFRGLARRRGAALVEREGFPAELFPTADHEEEVRLRIGPFADAFRHHGHEEES